MYAQMYASIDLMKSFVEIGSDRPMILCEYEHAMGNSVGNLNEYWELIRQHQALQGGFIWDWVDQTITTHIESGLEFQGYGGDFEPEGHYHDGNFSANGLLDANRKPHPHAYEVKHVYQDITATFVSPNEHIILLENRRFFKNLGDVELRWELLADGVMVESGVNSQLSTEARNSEQLIVPIKSTLIAGVRYHLNLKFRLKEASLALSKGHEVAAVQLSYSYQELAQVTRSETQNPSLIKNEDEWLLSVNNTRFSFDTSTGWLSQIKKDEFAVLASPIVSWFWRAPTDNDFGEGFPKKKCCLVRCKRTCKAAVN